MRKVLFSCCFAALFQTLVLHSADARVVRFVVEKTRPFAEGRSFGTTGAYERLDGSAVFEIDPRDPLNAGIVDIDKAPRNARGMVEFSSPFFILKPVDMAHGNEKIFYGLNNRGSKNFLSRMTTFPIGPNVGNPLSIANTNNPLALADANDDNLLLRQGYTYVDAGWQGDVAPGGDRLVPDLPVAALAEGRPIVAKVRIEYADFEGFSRPLEGNATFRGYEPADTDTLHATLTVRDSVAGERTPVAADRWAFGRCEKGPANLVPDKSDLCLFDGFKRDRIYELIYPAKNPIVTGLGYVVTRDIASFLRYQTHDDAGNPNPLARSATAVGIRRAYVAGVSQGGIYIRDAIYLGFNEDEAHRKVFDAAMITIAGAYRLFANVEFADPNTNAHEDENHDSVSRAYPPLTYAVTTDPISGIRDGILKRPATDPLIFQIDSSLEFWQYGGSLNVVDGKGEPVSVPDNVRLYFAASFQHGGGAGLLNPPGQYRVTGTAKGMCQNLPQGDGWATTMRALLTALDAWADRGVEPPASNYPMLKGKTLVTRDEARSAFPAIPGVQFPNEPNRPAFLKFGPDFGPTGGRLSLLPPVSVADYDILVPRPDADGIDAGGIRSVEVAAPLGTLTGWNTRMPGHREGNLCSLSGSYIPFARTRAERQASGDPRLSLEERYTDQAGFVGAVERAARRLVAERFLLPEDADRYVAAAAAGYAHGL